MGVEGPSHRFGTQHNHRGWVIWIVRIWKRGAWFQYHTLVLQSSNKLGLRKMNYNLGNIWRMIREWFIILFLAMIKVLGEEQYTEGIYLVLLWSVIMFFSCSVQIANPGVNYNDGFHVHVSEVQTFPGSLSSRSCLGQRALPKWSSQYFSTL